MWHPLPAGWQTCWLIHSCSFINDSWPREFQKKTTGRREREHERCSVCESEEACSTAAVPVTPVVRLNTPIQSISLHSSFAILPFTQWKQRRRRRERVYQCCQRRTKSYRERERARAGKKVRFSSIETLTLCHIDKVCVRLRLILCVSHTHIQRWLCRNMLWNPAASLGRLTASAQRWYHRSELTIISRSREDNCTGMTADTHVLARLQISQIFCCRTYVRQHKRPHNLVFTFSSLFKASRWGPQSTRAGQRPWGWSIMQRNSLSPLRSALLSSLSRGRWVCEHVCVLVAELLWLGETLRCCSIGDLALTCCTLLLMMTNLSGSSCFPDPCFFILSALHWI